MCSDYIFTSARLGFRNWTDTDVLPMSEINMDEEVMKYFPSTQSIQQTAAFIERMRTQFKEIGYCYFAVDILENSTFIGFIGLSIPTFTSIYTPCTDIGWRLKKSEWNNGYATEGAKRCLQYAFDTLKLNEVYAFAPLANNKSWQVMEKLGMMKLDNFIHPLLHDTLQLKECVTYKMKK